MSNETKRHIYRTVPPWRTTKPLTECGHPPDAVAEVESLETAVSRFKREGQTRFALTTCMTCFNRVRNGHSLTSWEDDPMAVITRDSFGPDREVAARELHALAALVASHPDEYQAIFGNDLATRRAVKARSARRS